MSVYVDWPTGCLKNANWRWSTVTHLISDDTEELHRFARRIGLKRAWFQTGSLGDFPHYDLTDSKYEQALAAGAVQLTRKTLCDVFQRVRDGWRTRKLARHRGGKEG